jgi:transcriptional regulator with XRE-family HTH domain
MPLDTGVFADVEIASRPAPAARRSRVTLDPNGPLGEALKAARIGLGLTLDEVSDATRVKVRHLAAIEAGQIDHLPSRPFAIGYVRAYAKELGADADAAASRFRTEFPSPDDDLHSPAGVRHAQSGRNRSLMIIAGVAVMAVVGWNVVRHTMVAQPHKASAPQVRIVGAAPAASGPFTAGAPLPPPPEAGNPARYDTPGLAAATAAGGSADAADAANRLALTQPQSAADNLAATPPTFVAQGNVYGPSSGASSLIIQALKPISLEVRGAGGVVYFARQLAAGEAYRVPALPGLTAEVSNPASAALYENGVSRGLFTQAQMPLKVAG